MSSSGRKRKQQLKPRQDEHRSPVKRRSVDIKTEPLDGYPALADYDLSTADIKPDLTELQLQQAVEQQVAPSVSRSELDHQESDSDEDGYSELNYQAADVFCQDEPDYYDPDWSSQQAGSRLLFQFPTPSHQTGLKFAKRFQGPIHYFNHMLGDRSRFFNLLAANCNQGRGEMDHPSLHATAEEMETFVALSLLMSDLKLERLSDYWSTNMFYGFVGFTGKMPLERYQQLLHNLNFDPEHPVKNKNKPKDFPLLTFINERMAELYVCGQQLVLNEPITLWKGRFSYHEDLPSKFRTNSLLLHMLTEQSGLVVKLLPEIVHQEDAQAWVRNSRQLVEHRTELALKLMQDHHGGRTVYVSKFYGSYGLAHELAKRSTYCTGLLDRNRYGNSKALVHQRLDSNSISTSYAKSLMMAKWRRRAKSFYFFSSDCLAIYAKELSMQKTNARPKLIQELDWQLRPGNESRQHLIHYQPACQEIPAAKKVGIFLLNILVYNAYLLYLANSQNPRGGHLKSYSEYRVVIIKSLLKEEVISEPMTVSPHKADVQEKLKDKALVEAKLKAVRHEPVLIQQNGKPARKNCRHCHKGGMLQFSKFMCNSCPDKPGLCQEPCFRLWHEQLKK
ncbi:LOW QUALITY PROTEIN: uncharacterized protein LOC108143913 [Drosophila elegans]|uniref:LOW QUALITY PROTEIN: uncharacterized protein LOC108143913 n=1 Tax=Drosophila elegans TaxID=30023 RepID=UPI001BC83A54|nr:LOW QUALITY PROTEIN: uncharacterized protein LOC108143913 [Drosophila elegans]